MNNIKSNADDCLSLAKILKYKMDKKVDFIESDNTMQGKYYLDNFELSFNYEFLLNNFLKLSIISDNKDQSIGLLLASLSDFYKEISDYFGKPTFFYTTNDNESFNLYWAFTNKKEVINSFFDNTFFEEMNVKRKIIINSNNQLLDKEECDSIETKIGLPHEFLPLIALDYENYFKYYKMINNTKKKQK